MIERDGARLPITITPKSVEVEQKTEGKIGASVNMPEELMNSMLVEYSLSPLKAIPAAIETTYYYSVTTLKMMGKMLIGRASVENLSGPISIAQYAEQSASMGFVPFIKFMALVSVSLGVLNLLPVPVLDGGHLLFLQKALKQSVSERYRYFSTSRHALLVSMVPMFLDIQRLFQ
jgi:regulator of sigma E protease